MVWKLSGKKSVAGMDFDTPAEQRAWLTQEARASVERLVGWKAPKP